MIRIVEKKLWGFGAPPLNAVLIFPNNFLNFGLDTIEKQYIINLTSNSSKTSASLVLSDSKVAFFGEAVIVHTFLYCVLFIDIIREVCRQIFLSSKLGGGYFVESDSFSVFNFFQYRIKFFLCKLS